MSEEIKSVDAKVDELEAAAKKYASKDTVISIGGYEFTPAKLMVAFTIVSSTLGGLYGAFEVYKDYMSMKKKIAEYVTPDLTEIYKKLDVVQVQGQELRQQADKSVQYTQDIKNDLKGDIRRLESVVDNVERSQKQSAREVDQQVREVQAEMRKNSREMDNSMKQAQRDMDNSVKQLQREVDQKIQKAIDNPLANK
jgi:uncharacterized protein YoxC